MFDIGAAELLVIVVVAILVIGPKDLPLALRTAGRWIGKIRRVSGHFRSGIETMIREAEMEEMETKWREQNRRIMEEHPAHPQEGSPAEPDAPEEMRPLADPQSRRSSTDASAAEARGIPASPPVPGTPPSSDSASAKD